jgi:hypothetical protein
MATRAANAGRAAEIQKRETAAVESLAEVFGVEVAPAFPFVRDREYRLNDERERLVMTLERIVAKAQEEN